MHVSQPFAFELLDAGAVVVRGSDFIQECLVQPADFDKAVGRIHYIGDLEKALGRIGGQGELAAKPRFADELKDAAAQGVAGWPRPDVSLGNNSLRT
jgi:hypothetical protein